MTDPIHAEKRIRTRSVGNVETDRLLARLAFIRPTLADDMRACEQKEDARSIVREIVNVERELARRGVPFDPLTDGQHLAIDLDAARTIMPGSHAERRAKTAWERAKHWRMAGRYLHFPRKRLTLPRRCAMMFL